MAALFLYGTLCDRALLALVLGRRHGCGCHIVLRRHWSHDIVLRRHRRRDLVVLTSQWRHCLIVHGDAPR